MGLLQRVQEEAQGSPWLLLRYWCEKCLKFGVAQANARFGWRLRYPDLFGRDYVLTNRNGRWKIKHGSDFTFILKPSYESELEEHLVCENGVFLDVGAHAGKWSVFVARHSPGARVLAFEVNPDTFKYLEENIRLNGLTNVTAFNDAASNISGMVELDVESEWTGTTKISKNGNGRKFPSVRLDELLAREKVRADEIKLIKIDAEGHELAVLEGLGNYLKSLANNARIVCEVLPGNDAALRFLTSLGFEFEQLKTGTDYLFRRVNTETAQTNVARSQNEVMSAPLATLTVRSSHLNSH